MVSPLSFLNSSPIFPVAISIRFVIFLISAMTFPVTIVWLFGFPKVSSTSLYKLFMASSESMMLLVHILALSLVCSALLWIQQVLPV